MLVSGTVTFVCDSVIETIGCFTLIRQEPTTILFWLMAVITAVPPATAFTVVERSPACSIETMEASSKADGNISAVCNVVVTKAVKGIKLDKTVLNMFAGETYRMTYRHLSLIADNRNRFVRGFPDQRRLRAVCRRDGRLKVVVISHVQRQRGDIQLHRRRNLGNIYKTGGHVAAVRRLQDN